jgi:hypothetical protein
VQDWPGRTSYEYPGIAKPFTLPAIKMTLRIFIVIVLTSLISYCYSQAISDGIYVGTVTGQPKAEFFKTNSTLARTIGLPDIVESKSKIEIRLYETYFLAGLTYCTTLYFDTTLKINRTKYWKYYDSTKYQPKETNPLYSIIPSKAFSALIANGVFSLPNKDVDEILKESRPKDFSEKGLTDANLIFIADGVGYTIEYKVDNIYNRIKFNNPDTYFKSYPDNQLFRRQYEITTALGAGFE